MKKLLVIISSILLFSCSNRGNVTIKTLEKCKHNTPNSIMIIPADTSKGRQTFTVIFEDEKALDYMYPEEIANGLKTGKWEYNEDIELINN